MMRGREEDSRRVKPEHLCLSPVEAGGAELLNSTPSSSSSENIVIISRIKDIIVLK